MACSAHQEKANAMAMMESISMDEDDSEWEIAASSRCPMGMLNLV
jgi:hypothetical protein